MSVLHILYVEDNEALRETIGMLMEADERTIALAASGEEALRLCAAQAFDLVISDVSLPGISGEALATRLLAADPAQRIVLCSGHDVTASALALGANVSALRKPFEFEELEALIVEAAAARPPDRNR